MQEGEGQALARRDGEAALGVHVLAMQIDRRAHHQHLRPRDRRHRVAVDARHPGHRPAVVEAHDEVEVEIDAAFEADHDAHDVGDAVAGRHEVDEHGAAGRRPEGRLEDQRAIAIAPRGGELQIARRDAPAAVLRRADQRGEAGTGIEARQAEPVDRAVLGDEGCAFAVPDHGVVGNTAMQTLLLDPVSWPRPQALQAARVSRIGPELRRERSLAIKPA